jgi:hypothetical protein
MRTRLIRRLAIRAAEMAPVCGTVGAVWYVVYTVDPGAALTLAYIFVPVLALVIVLSFYFMPVSCRIVDRHALARTPVRRIVMTLLESPQTVRGGLIPRARAYFCYGYRGLTFNVDCGDDYYFSTPDCDGTWLVAEAEIGRGRERRRLWLCGCARQ